MDILEDRDSPRSGETPWTLISGFPAEPGGDPR
jgi:hypothetical protein